MWHDNGVIVIRQQRGVEVWRDGSDGVEKLSIDANDNTSIGDDDSVTRRDDDGVSMTVWNVSHGSEKKKKPLGKPGELIRWW